MQRMFATAALTMAVAGSALSGHAARGRLSAVACDALGATTCNDSLRALPEVKVQAPRNEQERVRVAGFSQNGETFRRMPTGDVVDVLHTLPAVWVRSLGGFGTSATVGTRGLGAAHTAVFVDGFPMGDAENATIDVSPFSLHRLNTVTIDVGEAPELPVPVRALGASTLHFTTLRRPLRIWLTVGAFGYRAAGAITSFSTPAGQLQLLLDGEKADNDFPFVFDNGFLRETRRRHAAETRRWTPTVHWSAPSTAKWGNAEGGFRGNFARRQLPGAVLLYAVQEGERMDDDEAALHGRWSRRRGAWQWTAAAQWSAKNKFYEARDPQYPNGGRTDRYRQQEGWISVGTAHTLSSHWQWAYVMDATRSVLHQHGENEREARRTMVQQALSLRFRDQKWTATLRLLRHDLFNSARQNDPTNPGTAADAGCFTLQGGAQATLLKRRRIEMGGRAMIQTTFRPPTFAESYYFRYGNTQLHNERAFRLNIGGHAGGDFGRWQWQASVDAFVDRITDGIVAVPITPAVWRTQNLDRVLAQGVDLTASARFVCAAQTEVNLTGHGQWAATRDRSDAASRSFNLTLPYRPTQEAFLALDFAHRAFGASTSLVYCGERWATPQHLAASRLPPYAEWNAAARWKYRICFSTLTLRATWMNLTDTQRESIRGYPLPGRTWIVDATFEW